MFGTRLSTYYLHHIIMHMMKSPSPSVFVYCKQSKTVAVEGLGMKLIASVEQMMTVSQSLDSWADLH